MIQESSYDTIGVILSIHAMIDVLIAGVVEDIPEGRMTEQMRGIVNHPAWTLSHLNAYAGELLSMFDDSSVPTASAEMERYGYGTTPVRDPGAYGTKRELLSCYRERNARLSAVVGEKHAVYFPRPSPERYRPNSPTIGHIAITLLVAHPPHHLGQLNQWRRAAGLTNHA